LNENEYYKFTKLEIKTKALSLNNTNGRTEGGRGTNSLLDDAEIKPDYEKIQEKNKARKINSCN